jgi:hypothetical protein
VGEERKNAEKRMPMKNFRLRTFFFLASGFLVHDSCGAGKFTNYLLQRDELRLKLNCEKYAQNKRPNFSFPSHQKKSERGGTRFSSAKEKSI